MLVPLTVIGVNAADFNLNMNDGIGKIVVVAVNSAFKASEPTAYIGHSEVSYLNLIWECPWSITQFVFVPLFIKSVLAKLFSGAVSVFTIG